MAWISIHEEVDGKKLRKLYKAIGCSKYEALGILVFLWFWGLKNADETGFAEGAEIGELSRYLYGCYGESEDDPEEDMRRLLEMRRAAEALVETGWIDMVDGGFRLHDWDVWQEQWYKFQKTRAYNADRKRKERAAERERKKQNEVPAGDTPVSAQDSPPDDGETAEKPPTPPPPPPAPKKEPKKSPEKKQFADFVKMTQANYDTLLERYGEEFTLACIAKLDNHKGASGKTYKDDYRAILSWVVDAVNEKNPGMMKRSKASRKQDGQSLPFEE